MKIYMAKKGKVLEVSEILGTFVDCINAFKAEGLELITARQLAEARMLGGANTYISQKWAWVAENFNYFPNGDILVASKEFNPLLQYPYAARIALYWHRKDKESFLPDEIIRSLLEGTKQKDKVLQLKRKEVPESIPTDAFAKEPLTAFLFGDKAEEYGLFLKANGINNIPLDVFAEDYAKKQGDVFSRTLKVDNLINNSALRGYDYITSCYGEGGRAFGMRRL